MCGRYVNISKLSEIEKRFKIKAEKGQDNKPNPNVSLGEYAPVILNEDGAKLDFLQFGFSPNWAKKRSYLLNARSEGSYNLNNDPFYTGPKGIFEKVMFEESIRSKRCLIIADAFIEGPEKAGLNRPYLIYKKDKRRPFAMAGIWDEWEHPLTGERIRSFAIVTTASTSLLQKINHHRAPVILNREDEEIWLDTNSSEAEISDLLTPFDSDQFNGYPISPAIKSAKAKEMNLLMPVGPRLYKNHSYEIFNDIQTEHILQPAIHTMGIQQQLF